MSACARKPQAILVVPVQKVCPTPAKPPAELFAVPTVAKAAQGYTGQLIAPQEWTRAQAGVDTNGSRPAP